MRHLRASGRQTSTSWRPKVSEKGPIGERECSRNAQFETDTKSWLSLRLVFSFESSAQLSFG